MPVALVDPDSKLRTGPGIPRLNKYACGPGPGQADLPADIESILKHDDVRRRTLLVLNEGQPASVVAQVHHWQLPDTIFSQSQMMMPERMRALAHLGEFRVDVAVGSFAGGDQIVRLAWLGQTSSDPGKPHFVDAIGTLVTDLGRKHRLWAALWQPHPHRQKHAGLLAAILQLGKTDFELIAASAQGRWSRLVRHEWPRVV